MLSTTQLLDLALIGVFGHVVATIVVQPGALLDRYWHWLDALHQRRPKLAKPLGYCSLCFAGQVALWWQLFQHVPRDLGQWFALGCGICVSIAAAQLLLKLTTH